MTFTLNIQFLGLCMFVPDPASPPGTTLVLMPSTPPDMPPHVAMLGVDAACLQPGSSALTGQLTMMPLQGAELSFTGLGAPSTAAAAIPAEIANVGDVVRRPIVAAVFESDPGSYLTARVVLDSGTCAAAGVDCWRYPWDTPERQLAQGALWTIPDVADEPLALVPTLLGNGPAPLLPPLYPVQTGTPPVSRLDLVICHTSVYELPIIPQGIQQAEAGTPGSHFRAFYSLFEMDFLQPRHDPVPCRLADDGELPYTCMGPAQSLPNPT